MFDNSGDPSRPFDGHYIDLNYVPWYARMSDGERLRYLDWIIGKREDEIAAWRAQHPTADVWDEMVDKDLAKIRQQLHNMQRQHRIELATREPLPDRYTGPANYHDYLDSQRWKRRRPLKMVAVGWRCEHPNCSANANECHHLHYDNVGFETNADLEALCAKHHQTKHGLL